MHKQRFNVLNMEFELKPRGPLLVKSGTLSPNPSLPDMQFVRTRTPEGEKVFIPGSSLKGVFRSFTEKVLRTMDKDLACDPFNNKENKACGRKLKDEENTAKIYKESCHACKIYGNTRLRGRLSFTDFMPQGEVITETRYGVAISRLTNAVAFGPFDMEVLLAGTFTGHLILENFETWQVGIIGLTLRAMEEGLVRVGFGKNRGFGEVTMPPVRVTVEMAKSSPIPPQEIWGVGMFTKETDTASYGFHKEDRITGLPEGKEEDLGIYVRREYTGEEWSAMAEKAIACLGNLRGGKKP